MIRLREIATEIHKNAIEHGWWDTNPPVKETIALIHSEWSEALDEYRNGRAMVWYRCVDQNFPCQECESYDPENRLCKMHKRKPEGIAVELIDGCIRIIDFAAKENICFNFDSQEKHEESFPSFVAELHRLTDEAMDWIERDGNMHGYGWEMSLGTAIKNCFCYIRKFGYDPMDILLEKHEYNKTRPYRHGGKLC